jgi:hypothetical protein
MCAQAIGTDGSACFDSVIALLVGMEALRKNSSNPVARWLLKEPGGHGVFSGMISRGLLQLG